MAGETDCIIWAGPITRDGYGRSKNAMAHREAYEQRFGAIPDGLVIDHLCRVRACVNPLHMEAVTIAENTRRGNGPTAMNARKTHCIHGHELSAANSYCRPDGDGVRQCRACNRAARRAYKQRKREKAA